MKTRKQKIIKRAVVLGIGYPILAFIFAPIGLFLGAWLLDSFPASSAILAKTCWYIYFAPCLIGFGVTKLLIPTDLIYFRIMTFFITQIIVYYFIGWLLAKYLLNQRKAKPLPESNSTRIR